MSKYETSHSRESYECPWMLPADFKDFSVWHSMSRHELKLYARGVIVKRNEPFLDENIDEREVSGVYRDMRVRLDRGEVLDFGPTRIRKTDRRSKRK